MFRAGEMDFKVRRGHETLKSIDALECLKQ